MPVIVVWLLPILEYLGVKIEDYMNKPKKKKHCFGWVIGCGCPCTCNKQFKRAGCCQWEPIHQPVATQEQDGNDHDSK